MEHFLGYHIADNEGPYLPDGRSRQARIKKFYTAKPFRAETLVGNKVWVIEGRSIPRRYRIVSTGTIITVKPEKRPKAYQTPERQNGLVIEFRADEFNEPTDVTNFDWFKTLKESQQNFSRGFTRLTDPNTVKELEAAWSNFGAYNLDSASEDIKSISNDKKIDATTKRRLIDSRLGQGHFRDELETRWSNACAITGCKISSVLRASHIKAWKDSNNEERLDPNNGLLLAAHIDALFDCGLITFRDDGKMLISRHVSAHDRMVLQLGQSISKNLTAAEKRFLQYHRANRFQDNR